MTRADSTSELGSEVQAGSPGESRGLTRRELVRRGVKLAFIAPVVTTFFAQEAYAAGSNHSCYPTGHACGGGEKEDCCSGACVLNVCT